MTSCSGDFAVSAFADQHVHPGKQKKHMALGSVETTGRLMQRDTVRFDCPSVGCSFFAARGAFSERGEANTEHHLRSSISINVVNGKEPRGKFEIIFDEKALLLDLSSFLGHRSSFLAPESESGY